MSISIERPFRVLVFGYINLNVVDGSAFFIAALAKMLSMRAGTQVDVLSANRLRSHLVTHEIESIRNVDLIDVFTSSGSSFDFPSENGHTLSRSEAIQAILKLHLERDYDAVIIRDLEVAAEVGRQLGAESSRLFSYVTGVPHLDQPIAQDVECWLRSLMNSNANFLVQTSTMLDKIEREVEGFSVAESLVLGPFVPNSTSMSVSGKSCDDPLELIYAGKFYSDWIPEKIIAGFNFARERVGNMHLTVAGNAFKDTVGETRFVRDTKYMLSNTAGVEWVGGVARGEVRRLLAGADLGISWRSSRLDSSTEFSTKVLEYGAVGVPSIVNRSPVNVSFLGDDYPLYVDDMESFVSLLVELGEDRTKLDAARGVVSELATAYSYDSVSSELLSFIDRGQAYELDTVGRPLNGRIVIRDSATDIEDLSLGGIDPNSNACLSWRSGYAYVSVDEDATQTVEELILEVLLANRLRAQLSNMQVGEEIAAAVGSASEEANDPTSAPRGLATSARPDDAAVSGEGEPEHERVDELESRVADLTDDLIEARSRLESLRASKLGRLQRWWWSRK